MKSNILPVSVVMPLYNDERHVVQALTSLVAGETRPAEIIVVDNASIDGSVATVEGLALPGLKLIRNPDNVGATRARDQAIDLASQPNLFFIDSDDWVGPDALAVAYRAMGETGCDIVLLHMLRMSPDGGEVLFSLQPPTRPVSGSEALELTLGTWRIGASGIYERDLYRWARTLFTYHGFSDDELLSRLIFAEARSVVGCEGTFHYRLNPKSYTFAKVVGQTITNLRSVALGAERLGADHPRTRAMRDVVVRNLFGLRVRALRGEGEADAAKRLAAELRALRIPFGLGNGKARLMALALRLLP